MTKRDSRRRGDRRTSGTGRRQVEFEETVDLLDIGSDGDPGGDDLLEFEGSSRQRAIIKVVGVGGGGGNALRTMIQSGLSGVEFIAANTDAQALQHNEAPIKVQLGAQVTRGLGCGANPEKGRASALEARDRLHELLEGTDMVFVTAGMGGGTGTGAAPIIAEVAREVGALTVGVVTKPFAFEGKVRARHCERGIEELHQTVDTLITIPNQRLLALAGKQTGIMEAFKLADDVLLNAVRGISDLITIHGLINLDFADVRTVMNEAGVAMMGTGTGNGDTRAADAARAAISSPLLEDLSIEGARGVLINITGGEDMTLFEVNEASTLVQEAAHEEANIIFGAVLDEDMPSGEMRVTVIATGLSDGHAHRGRSRHDEEFGPVVRALHPDPAPGEREAPSPAAAASRHAETARQPERAGPAGGIDSPFEEDEFDVPAFIRRRTADSDEEDREEPAFLRRAQD
ncbi:MAG: cell division protein FtsZ [Proteobacteria bacterium]|nr:cell division protein FtsZ [Pseudomonadota bacterium]MCZ6781789.1 cell division protein FtsZ [Pseudomonadota bacterium]